LKRPSEDTKKTGDDLETAEQRRLRADANRERNWKRFGPYLAERQWGTVREDYSEHGTSWDYFPHDHARSRAYRWGEDGLFGLCDREGRLCFAVALWNGADAILKERLFGLNGLEGNHGEDVKEEYFYLDATPTHSYGKGLYKYPQRAFPYDALVKESARRGRLDREYELVDTGAFDEERYFDVTVEHAKASPDDILVAITVANRGPAAAPLVVLPTLWFRNTWAWGRAGEGYWKGAALAADGASAIVAQHPTLGRNVQFGMTLMAVALFFWIAIRPAWSHVETDFPNYYTAAAELRRGTHLRDLYDWTSFQRAMNRAGFETQLGAYTPQTPLTMLPFVPLTDFSPLMAKRIWLCLNFVLLLATLWLLSRMTRFRMSQLFLLAFLGLNSWRANFAYGQYYIVVLFLLTFALYCLEGREIAAGIVAGIVFVLKLYGGPFLFFFLAQRRWRASLGIPIGFHRRCFKRLMFKNHQTYFVT